VVIDRIEQQVLRSRPNQFSQFVHAFLATAEN